MAFVNSKDYIWEKISNARRVGMWVLGSLLAGLFLMVYMAVFTGPAQVAIANAPYTVFPVLILAGDYLSRKKNS